MSQSIPTKSIDFNQFSDVLVLKPAVVVLDASHFRLRPLCPAEPEHRVTFDSAEKPTAVSCTCAEGALGVACWAMARSLDVWRSFSAHNVYFWPRGWSQPSAPGVRLHASIDEDGGLNLTTAPPVSRGEGVVVLVG